MVRKGKYRDRKMGRMGEIRDGRVENEGVAGR